MKINLSKKYYAFGVILLVVGYFGYQKLFTTPKVEYVTTKVELGTLKQTVSETGTIKRASEVSLNFLAQGRIATETVSVGARVKKGQVLAELDYTNLKIQVRQAEANLEVARANQQKILNGATFQDINIGQTSLSQAQTALDNAIKDLSKTTEYDNQAVSQAQKNFDDLNDSSVNTPSEASLNSAQVSLNKNKVTYQNAINNRIETLLVAIHDKNSVAKNALDNVNRILTDDNAKDTLAVADSSKLLTAKENYGLGIAMANNCDVAYAAALKTKSIADTRVSSRATSQYLTKAIVALNNTYSVLDKTITSSKFSQTQLDTFKSTINSQITLANAGLTALEQSRQAMEDSVTTYDSVIANSQETLKIAEANMANSRLTAQNALTNAKLARTRDVQTAQARVDASSEALKISKAQLTKTTATSRPEDIALVAAQTKQAQASLDSVKNQILNYIIKAPFDGVITQRNYDPGEEPGVSKPVFVLMGEDQFEINLDIAESDIAKVAIGNAAIIDFDAFGEGIKFSGSLDMIDPAQTVIQEVVYYKGTIGHISTASSTQSYLKQIKSGMTANVVINTNEKSGVMIAPFRAVVDKNGVRTMRVLRNKEVIELTVSVGMKGDNGLVEILSGLSVGDEIILSTK